MRSVAIIQARLGSTRLPQKILADINGHSVLWHVWRRAMRSSVEEVVIAVPEGDRTELIHYSAEHHWANNIWSVKDLDEDDVLGRFYWLCRQFEPHVVVRLTSDCPLTDWRMIDQAIAGLADADYCRNRRDGDEFTGYPDGYDVEAFTYKALEATHYNATEREHVTAWMADHVRTCTIEQQDEAIRAVAEKYKFSVDTEADLEFVRSIYSGIGHDVFGIEQVMEWLNGQRT